MTKLTQVIPLVIVLLLGALLLRRSIGGRGRSRRLGDGLLGAGLLGDAGLVASREVRERMRGRLFRVGTLLILAVVAAAIVIPAVSRGSSHAQQVAVVGTVEPVQATVIAAGAGIGASVHVAAVPTAAAARADLRSGRAAVAVIGRDVVVDRAISPTDISATAQLARAVSRALGAAAAIRAAGLTPAQAAQLARARPLPVTSLQPAAATGTPRGVSLVGLILVFLMLTQYNAWTLVGVMEEKSSRVVEVLLATVRPGRLLAGKVLGIGLVAFAQAALIVVVALGIARAVGSDLLHGTAPLVLVSTLVWLVLGYAFYCWVYAAAGAMAERQDQVQALALPLTLPIIFGYITALTAASSGGASTLVRVLAYLPPTAPFAMPVLVGLGEVTWWEFAASVALSVAGTVGVARLATGIYRRAILRTGRRVRLREIFPGAAR